jgi:outer membrane receptor protein involved in Fe transport
MHLISNSTTSSPTDKWIPNSNIIKPEISDQVSLGYFRNFKDNAFEFSVEGYYKWMQNQIDYRDGADENKNETIETELLFGKGRAYGIEFLLKKKQGKFTGWIGYTLSRTEKQIEGINNNKWYLAKQDRMHDISVVGIYELTKRWDISATWVYYTGNAVTFPSGKYEVANNVVFYYTERNGYRMPAYHRLDIAATFKLKERKRFSSELAFSIYNVYARENAYVITFQQDPNDASKTQALQTSLFKLVPSISYNFKF